MRTLPIAIAFVLMTTGLVACTKQERWGSEGTPSRQQQQLSDIKECERKKDASWSDFTACMQRKGYRKIEQRFEPLDLAV